MFVYEGVSVMLYLLVLLCIVTILSLGFVFGSTSVLFHVWMGRIMRLRLNMS